MNRLRARALMAATLLLPAASACVTIRRPAFMQPAPRREWPSILAAAQDQVSRGKFDAADSLLSQFAGRYPESPEAIETAYWRALFGIDPANPHASLATATTFLDAYLRGPRPRAHPREAAALARVVAQLEELNKNTAVMMAQTKEPVTSPKPLPGEVRIDVPKPVPDPAGSLESEVKRLKEELAKANAELERIRRRLAQPPPRL